MNFHQRKFLARCVHMQQISEIIPTKSSKITIHENLDPQKFSAIWYAHALQVILINGCELYILCTTVISSCK